MIFDFKISEIETALNVAKLMLVAARVVLKARCEDRIKTAIVTGEDKDKLAKASANLQRLGILLSLREH